MRKFGGLMIAVGTFLLLGCAGNFDLAIAAQEKYHAGALPFISVLVILIGIALYRIYRRSSK